MLVSSDSGFSVIVTKCFIENALKKENMQTKKKKKDKKCIKAQNVNKKQIEYLGLQQLYTYICMHNIYPLQQMEIPWL